MRRSAAPSRLILNKPYQRPSFFSPPYKTVTQSAKYISRPISNLTKESSCLVNESLDSIEDAPTPRTTADLLNIIEEPQKQEKENIHVDISLAGITNELCTANTAVTKGICSKYDVPQNTVDAITFCRYFSVVWCKLSKKKHKKWEGDAVLIVKGRSVVLKDMEGKEIGRSSGYKLKDLESLEEGNTLPVGAKEIEIQGVILPQDYVSGRCFQNSGSLLELQENSVPPRPIPKPFRLPFMATSAQSLQGNQSGVKPFYDTANPNSVILPRPSSRHQWHNNSAGHPLVDVVVDPFLGSKLRPHQINGVIFLYECVMGFRTNVYKGAILADEMGLGKTLQCIAVIWTLIKQGPYGGTPILRRVLIVTPSSLVSNWGKEFDKWLGKERIQAYVVDQQNKVANFEEEPMCPVLIVSYEMLVRCIDSIREMKFDLMLCDEGHRLKNCQIKTTSLLASLSIQRRIIVTGTPVQNDLQELFSLVEFVNPGILGSSSMFRKVYEEPIIRSQQPSASQEEKEIGESRAAELNRLTSRFTLRRTQEIINKYLPPKMEFVVFCQPSKIQKELYEAVVGSKGLHRCLTNSEIGDHLSAICILRKLCNHPRLLCVNEAREHQSEIQNEISQLIPEEISCNSYSEQDSGKLAVVSCILWTLSEYKRERIVIVSNFTTSLDMLQELCERYKYPFLRFDGSTPSSKRQNLVDRFNSPYCKEFVFLLSSKAGGVGLNLVGASRILLFDIDWNPATDLQAMSRVWRDGQRKNVFIYRLILAGSIEEKMYQRQVCKQGISGSVVDARINLKVQFSQEELKDLFQFYPGISCLTHDLLNCPCDQMGGEGIKLSQNSPSDERECRFSRENNADQNLLKSTTMDQLFKWQHLSLPEGIELLADPYLESGKDFISFVFKCEVMQENCL